MRLLPACAVALCSLPAIAAPLRLAGTWLDDGRRVAIVDVGDAQQLLRAGDAVDGCMVRQVEARRVQLDCDGVPRTLVLHGDPTAPLSDLPSIERVQASREEFVAWIADRQRIVVDLDLVPQSVDGQLQGWRIDRVRDDSWPALHGLRSGDLIVALQSVPAADAQAFVETMRGVAELSQFELQLRRDERPLTLYVELR